MPHYYTDRNKFYNPFAMFAYAAIHTPYIRPKFEFYDSTFNDLNCSVEPKESLQNLMEQRAIQLRAKYDRLVFFFSGGTDSITIYNVFKKLNIHIDEIVVTYNESHVLGYSPKAVQWILGNCYDPSTLITPLSRIGSPSYLKYAGSNFITNPDYIYGGVFSTHLSNTYHTVEVRKEDRFVSSNSAIILGIEKPHILFTDKKWYLTHLDKVFQLIDIRKDENNVNGIEWFFISPDLPKLHIKQAHLLKNHVTQFINPQSDWSSPAFDGQSWQNHALLSRWCGLDDGVIHENNVYQKLAWNNLDFNLLHRLDPTLTPPPSTLISHNFENPGINNLYSNLLDLHTDRSVNDYVIRHGLLPQGSPINKYLGIYSKMLYLGT